MWFMERLCPGPLLGRQVDGQTLGIMVIVNSKGKSLGITCVVHGKASPRATIYLADKLLNVTIRN